MPSHIVYEQPLNEKVRALLRLEFLFDQARAHLDSDSALDRRHAILCLLDILNILSRSDIKGEITKELERHLQVLAGLSNNSQVDSGRLDEARAEVEHAVSRLSRHAGQPGNQLRDHDMLNAIKQRTGIPGGTCSFDLPALRFWLDRPTSEQIAELNTWFAELIPLSAAIEVVLRILRASASTEQELAAGGSFHKSLSQQSPCKLVRVFIAPDLRAFPEVSGGRHRFSVRFLVQPASEARAQQLREDVQFGLACCSF